MYFKFICIINGVIALEILFLGTPARQEGKAYEKNKKFIKK